MKHRFLPVLIAVFLACLSPAAEPVVVDKVLVVINDEIITQGDVNRILLPIYGEFKNIYSGRELESKLSEARKNVIGKLIEDKLLLAEAKRREIEVESTEIENRINKAKKQFSTEEEFRYTLTKEGLGMSDLGEKYKTRIMIDKLIRMEVAGKIAVSPSEVVNYYKDNIGVFEERAMTKLRSIFIRITDERTEREALKLAKRLLRRLEEGGEFTLLASKYSDGAYASSGGDRGWVKKGELMDRIDGLVFSMEKGELSGVLKTKLGFHIFKVEDKKPSKLKEFREVKDQIEEFLFNNKIHDKLSELINRLKEDAYIVFK